MSGQDDVVYDICSHKSARIIMADEVLKQAEVVHNTIPQQSN